MTVRIINADVLAGLAQLPDESVHCVVTSPPYWGLRDYGVDGQIGLEATPQAFVARMVEVFREVRRVLRKDGTCWVNMGDSYAGGGGFSPGSPSNATSKSGKYGDSGAMMKSPGKVHGLKAKDLCGVPWRLAFALQDDGWWLRQDIIWAKPNPMPESVTDRCTKAHEYIFLLTKAERYFYDAEAIKEVGSGRIPGNTNPLGKGADNKAIANGGSGIFAAQQREQLDRNKRSVWSIATNPFPEAHFATFPPELPEICIKAGCPAGGTVLDPFSGAGTAALVADRLQRNAIGIELNPVYAAMSEKRIAGDRGGLLDIMEAAE
jgi:DNA modification methylase